MNVEIALWIGTTAFLIISGVVSRLWWRIERTDSNLSSLREKLAKDYHDGPEVRQLIQDLMAPVREQLTRIEALLIAKNDPR